MSTNSRNISAAQDGTAYTSDLNDGLAAVDTCHAGASAPTTEVVDGKLWLDTSGVNPILRIYRGAWVPLFEVTTSGSTLLGTVTDDSHNHVISNIDGLQAAIDAAGVTTGDINQNFSAATLNVGTAVDLGAWTVTETGGNLYFSYNGVRKMRVNSSGDLTVTGDITAYGSI